MAMYYDCECSFHCYHHNITATPNHLQARTTTHDLAKQVAEVEKLTNETVTPLNDHSLFEKSRADVSKHLKHMFQVRLYTYHKRQKLSKEKFCG